MSVNTSILRRQATKTPSCPVPPGATFPQAGQVIEHGASCQNQVAGEMAMLRQESAADAVVRAGEVSGYRYGRGATGGSGENSRRPLYCTVNVSEVATVVEFEVAFTVRV